MLPEELYVEMYPVLCRIAQQKYRVPEIDVPDIVHDVFVRFAYTPGTVEKIRPFLIAMLNNACHDYWREEAKFDRDAAIPERVAVPRYDTLLTLRRVLGKLPPLQRRVLLLQARGWRVREIARIIGYSPSWTEKLLRKAREKAAEAADDTNHRSRSGRVRQTDTCESPEPPTANRHPPTVIIRAHVLPVRGPALPRAPGRAAVLFADRRSARQVRGQ